jgi:hypothetical protein
MALPAHKSLLFTHNLLLVFDFHASSGVCRFGDRIADDGIAVPIFKGCAERGDVVIVDNRVEQVCYFVHERMLPTDDMSLGPPVLPEGVKRFTHEHGREPLRFFGGFRPEHFEFVHALQIEPDRTVFAVDFEHFIVLAPLGKAASFEGTECAIFEFDHRGECIIHIHPAHAAARAVSMTSCAAR